MKKRKSTLSDATLLLPATRDPEVQRFLRPQPQLPIPAKAWDPRRVGFLAYQLLGHRIITGAGTL